MILHADLVVRSMDVALDFYCDKLGFVIVDEARLHGPIVRNYSDGCYDVLRLVQIRDSPAGAMIELVEFQPESALKSNIPSSTAHPIWISILIPDLKAHISRLKRKGVHPTSEIFGLRLSKSACEVVFYKDPDGNGLEFLQLQSSVA